MNGTGVGSVALDPREAEFVLERGYAICRDEQGGIMRDARAAVPGTAVNVRLARGALACRVEKVNPE